MIGITDCWCTHKHSQWTVGAHDSDTKDAMVMLHLEELGTESLDYVNKFNIDLPRYCMGRRRVRDLSTLNKECESNLLSQKKGDQQHQERWVIMTWNVHNIHYGAMKGLIPKKRTVMDVTLKFIAQKIRQLIHTSRSPHSVGCCGRSKADHCISILLVWSESTIKPFSLEILWKSSVR